MQYEKINTNCTYINTNGSKHSETGPVRQTPSQRTIKVCLKLSLSHELNKKS